MSIKRKIFVRAPLFVVCAIGLALSACGADDSETLPPDPEAGISCTAALQTRTSANGVQYVRTPNSCFNNLPDWNYEVKYVEIDGLRQAYYEAGPKSGEPILLLHGQPTWSYLYRFMIPVLAQGGYRVIAMDHVGMGRSDKPIDLKYHSFENHVNRLESFIRKLELKNLTAFVQDWGSVTGLTLASRKPELFDRIVFGNGGVPDIKEPYAMPSDIDAAVKQFQTSLESTPAQQPRYFDENGNPLTPLPVGGEDPFGTWIAYAMYSKDFKPSLMVEALTYFPVTAEELAAYNAPFPTEVTMAAARTFPSLINQLAGGVSETILENLKTYNKPFMTIFGGNEQGVPPQVQQWYIDNIAGAAGQEHHRYPDASHFVQDDKGADVAARVNKFMVVNPIK